MHSTIIDRFGFLYRKRALTTAMLVNGLALLCVGHDLVICSEAQTELSSLVDFATARQLQEGDRSEHAIASIIGPRLKRSNPKTLNIAVNELPSGIMAYSARSTPNTWLLSWFDSSISVYAHAFAPSTSE